MTDKHIAVLMATHNSAEHIQAQIDSLKAQTYGNFEILASDDASEDNTREILQKNGIRYIESSEKLGSAQANFVFLIQNAPEADYYMFCDHDDVWLENKIESTLAKMSETEKDGKPALVHSDLLVVDEGLRILSDSMIASQRLERLPSLANALTQSSVTGCTVMINKPLLLLAQRKKDAENIIMHDWFLAILALATGSIGFVTEPLIKYRQHSGNAVGAKDVGNVGYILERASAGKKNRKIIEDTFRQAKMIYGLYGDALGENAEIVRIYGELLNKGKLKRIIICAKYGFWKNSFVRRAAQLIYM